MPSLLLRNARLLGQDSAHEVRIEDGRIAAITRSGAAKESADEVVDLDGRVLSRGLWDEHVHFTQWTVRRARFDLSGTASAADVLDRLRRALASDPPTPGRIMTGYGFRDGTWPDEPSLAAIDAVAGDTPVFLISGDLHCAWMNSAAFAHVGHAPTASGLLREGPWLSIPPHLRGEGAPSLERYREAAEAAARRGVVGVVEFEHSDNLAQWPARVAAGVDQLRIETSIWPEYLEQTIASGIRTGDVLDDSGLVTMGPLKLVVDGSLNTRTAWCWDPYPGIDPDHPHPCGLTTVHPDEVRRLLAIAVPAGIAPAIHAIGDRANTEVIDIFAEFGIGGRIEHAQLVRAEDFARFGPLGLTASVQPEHAMDDRDVADHHWAGRTDRAFAFRSLLDGGATLRLGSDAPVAPLDPWVSIAAAVSRARDGRESWHGQEGIPLDVALAASTRGRATPEVGEVADLAVLDLDPFAATDAQLRELPVAGTILGGRWTWREL